MIVHERQRPAVQLASYEVEHSASGSRTVVVRTGLSWRAIFGGVFISLLAYLTLTALGIAIGSGTLQGIISGREGAGGLGVGSAIWLVISAFVSLFLGSYFAGRVSGLVTRRVGVVQGMVISALFFMFLVSQVGSTIGALGQGISSAVGTIGGAAGDLAKNPQVRDTIDRALGGLNLNSPPDQVAQGLATRLLRGDEEGAKNYLARQAGISRSEADRRFETLKGNFQNTARDIGTKAARGIAVAGWSLFGALVLGTLFACLGGGIGVVANLRHPLSESDERNLRRGRAA